MAEANTLDRYSPIALGVLRIVSALLFLEHGLMKLFSFPAAQPGVGPQLSTELMLAAVIEAVGGTLIALGLFTRPAAFICCGEMAVAYFIAHANQGFYPGLNGGDSTVLFCFVFLLLVFSGPGRFSVDAVVQRRA